MPARNLKPRRKVAAGALSAAALTPLVVWIASLLGTELPAAVAGEIAALLALVGGYFVPEA